MTGSAMHLVTASWPKPTSSFGFCLYDHCLVPRRQTHAPFHIQRLCPLCVVCGGQGAVVCRSLLSNLLCSPGRQWRAAGYFEEQHLVADWGHELGLWLCQGVKTWSVRECDSIYRLDLPANEGNILIPGVSISLSSSHRAGKNAPRQEADTFIS